MNSNIIRGNIARNIKFVRSAHHLTQIDFAKKLNLSRQAVGNYEAGIRDVDTPTIIKICTIFNIKIEDFLQKDLSTNDYTFSGEDLYRGKINEILNEMDEFTLKKILQMIELMR